MNHKRISEENQKELLVEREPILKESKTNTLAEQNILEPNNGSNTHSWVSFKNGKPLISRTPP